MLGCGLSGVTTVVDDTLERMGGIDETLKRSVVVDEMLERMVAIDEMLERGTRSCLALVA